MISDQLEGARIPAQSAKLDALKAIGELAGRMKSYETAHASLLGDVGRSWQLSARNLLHYLALRGADIRKLQDELSSLGLSSLGRAEAHSQATVLSVASILQKLVGDVAGEEPLRTGPSVPEARGLLAEHTDALLGPSSAGRRVRIMVTMPGEAADEPQVIEELMSAGMDVMRINCAHDDEARWMRMIQHLQKAKKRLGRGCKILMDLGGPKLRTGSLELEPAVIHWRPRRDSSGRPIAPATIWLGADEKAVPPSADAVLPVARSWLRKLEMGATLAFRDLRGRARKMRVVAVDGDGAWCESAESSYVGEGTELSVIDAARKDSVGRIGKLPPRERPIILRRGDTLQLTRAATPGRPALRDAEGRTLEPARIGCTLEAAFECARAGDSIWFDDGKFGGVVRRVGSDSLDVEITQMAKAACQLGSDKGINLPDTDLALAGLTEKDMRDLAFVVRHADAVGMSFVQSEDDVRRLESALRRLDARPDFGVVLKIETRKGFEHLPNILLAAMSGRPFGVMIARGDLAIECGYERMAELQEEILWISEAAHVPAIWATQVLESLAKKGQPSRAEITDAAMGERAECVMLNKGPHVVEAVRVLDDILRRMEAHQEKKSSRLRVLRLATRLDRSD